MADGFVAASSSDYESLQIQAHQLGLLDPLRNQENTP
jgi:hypothetical protein